MKYLAIISICLLGTLFNLDKSSADPLPQITFYFNEDDSLIVFDKLIQFEITRDKMPSGIEFENRQFETGDKAAIIKCTAKVSSFDNKKYLSPQCIFVVNSEVSTPQITTISKIAEGQGLLVSLNSLSDSSKIFNSFLNRNNSYYSQETTEIKVDQNLKILPKFAIRCKAENTVCKINVFEKIN